MSKRVDLIDSTYSHSTDPVLDAIRKETLGATSARTAGRCLQRCFAAVCRLTSERRLSRLAYVVEKRAR